MPLPLAAVVLGRDVVLLAGAFAIRAHTLGWKWPGAAEFFRIAPQTSQDDEETAQDVNPSTAVTPAAPVAPVVKPLFISKINTGLQFALVGACMTDAWLGWPGNEIVWTLGYATVGTTVASTVAYGRAFLRNELLVPDEK